MGLNILPKFSWPAWSGSCRRKSAVQIQRSCQSSAEDRVELPGLGLLCGDDGPEQGLMRRHIREREKRGAGKTGCLTITSFQ